MVEQGKEKLPAVGRFIREFISFDKYREQRAFVYGAGILIIAAIAMSLLYMGRPEVTASETAERYLSAYAEKRFYDAYLTLSGKFQKNYSKEQFELLGISVKKMGLSFKEPKIESERVIGQNAMVRYSLKVSGGPHGKGFYDFKGVASLSLEGGKWVIKQIAGLPEEWLKNPKNLE